MDSQVDQNEPEVASARPHGQPRGMWRALVVTTLALVFVVGALGFVGFLSQLRVDELKPASRADGIVVLTGVRRASPMRWNCWLVATGSGC